MRKPASLRHSLRLLALLLAPLLSAHAAQPPSVQDVAVLAATCFTCHGAGGRAPAAGAEAAAIPGLAGRDAGLLLQRLRAFKAAGPGTDAGATIMPLLLQAYDDAQLQALAAWFASKDQP